MVRQLGICVLGFLALGTCDAQGKNTSAAPGSGPQVLDFGQGNDINFSLIKTEAKEPISFNSATEMQLRLKNGGTVVISESDLVVGQPNFQKRGLQFMALDTLQLKKGARIITGGNDLVIFANKIISEDGSVAAFTDKTRTAANATTIGGGGGPGVDGGSVTFVAINGIEGRLHVDLSGQNGGDGTTGAAGANGAPGAKGENASSGVFGCEHGGGGGHDGTPGQKGATGGPAGNGGHGGSFFLYNVGDAPIPSAFYEFLSSGGKAGNPGAGGPGGIGGAGGDGGNGGGFCGGGPPGHSGANGLPGDTGPIGSDAAAGNNLVTNMSLEVLISKVKQIPLGTANQ